MDTADFAKTWSEIQDERQKLFNQRTDLETELLEIRKKIVHLDEVLNHLAPLADLSYREDKISDLGITDAIRFVLRTSNTRISAQEVRKVLTDTGYDLSGLSAPMASIYKILSRLSDPDSGEVAREKEDGHVYFKWIVPPMSDEDIPF